MVTQRRIVSVRKALNCILLESIYICLVFIFFISYYKIIFFFVFHHTINCYYIVFLRVIIKAFSFKLNIAKTYKNFIK